MYEAATKGLTWRVISADAMDVKGLGDIIQAGCNASAQLARGESEFQILKRVMNSINAHGGVGKQILFSSVKQAIMKTKPQCHEAMVLPQVCKNESRKRRRESRLPRMGPGVWGVISIRTCPWILKTPNKRPS